MQTRGLGVIAAGLSLMLAGMGCVVILSACREQSPTPAPAAPPPPPSAPWSTPMKVVVSIPPLKGLVEPLLPPGSTVTVLLQPGASEHALELTQAQVKQAISADMLIWIGGMEPKVDALAKANPRSARQDVKLADALKLHIHAHEHGGAHDGHDHHDHHGDDPHIWLDPVKAKEIVSHVAAKIAAVRTADGGGGGISLEATAMMNAQLTRLDALDKELQAGLAEGGAKDRTVVVAHDAYGWMAKRYGFKTVAISGLTAAEPTQASLKRARDAVREHKLKAVLSEPQLSAAAARSIAAETGATVIMLDPLGGGGGGDYFAMMRSNMRAIRAALGLAPLAPDAPALPTTPVAPPAPGQ